jgi:glutathione S-transferase
VNYFNTFTCFFVGQFEDVRLDFETFKAEKASGQFDLSMGMLPVLYGSNNLAIGQSKAIERHLAGKFGFLGDTPEEGALIDMLCEHTLDIQQKYSDIVYAKGKTPEEISANKANYITNDLPVWLKKLELAVPSSPLSVGSRFNLFDVAISQLIKDVFDDKEGANRALNECPKLTAIVDNFWNAIKAYVDARPVTPF